MAERKPRAFMPHRTLQKDGTVREGFAEREIVDALHGPTGNKEPLIVDSAAAASSAGSEDSTSASNELDTASSSSARPTPTGDGSSQGTGRECRAGQTLFISENQRAEVLLTEYARQLTSGGGKPGQGYPAILTSSAEASPAKTSPSPASGQDSPGSDRASSSSSPESQTLFSPMADGSSLRTFPDFFHPTVDEISQSYSRRWPSSGFTTSPGECWTADTSECPSDGAASSSLPDVLEAEVHPRFYLSRKAAAGILRRAEKRGKALPPSLNAALQALSTAGDEGGMPTPKTGLSPQSPPNGEREQEGPPATKLKTSCPYCAPDELCGLCLPTATDAQVEACLAARIPTPSDQKEPTPQKTEQAAVRRLSPTECERLQGFPDGWTAAPTTPSQTAPATPQWGMQ